jgi:hypothetical protein
MLMHGGANTFHETVLAGIPVLVWPVFGDQESVAETVGIPQSTTFGRFSALIQLGSPVVQNASPGIREKSSNCSWRCPNGICHEALPRSCGSKRIRNLNSIASSTPQVVRKSPTRILTFESDADPGAH